ncbi:MAG: S8 family serine peptidase [Bacteroidetes bacterium]|nr:S8 family serine peptidase [Bacteroidota bacterium]
MRTHLTVFSTILLLSTVISDAFADGPGRSAPAASLAASAAGGSLLDQLPPDAEFVPGTVIVKFVRERTQQLSKHQADIASVQPLLARFGVRRTTQLYPDHRSRFRADGSEIALQRMYRVEFDAAVSPLEVARAFAALPDVEYAEPEIVQRLFYTPDDPRFAEQYQHLNVQAKQAWDISTGDSTVVIAIVDSGVLWNHEDLYENMWVNPAEDIDGDGRYTAADIDSIDNDGNGYVDDVVGVDFVGKSAMSGGTYHDGDPSPTTRGHPHGTHVAGIAAARGNNGKGIAGLAMFCRIMAIKCAPDTYSPSIVRGYDGIVYAADNGADVINCSWGGPGYLESQKERIDYAIAKGAIVVAAAGNSGNERVHTPGAYPNVLCVANTNAADKVNPSSTYGPWVDVSAPGTDILSSVISTPSTYQKFTGTSMSSPLVAGLAGLVRSVFPQYSSEQVFEQIRVTSDPIDDLQYSRLQGKIGRGRINAFRALTEKSPAVRLIDWSWSDLEYGNGDGMADQGEKITVRMRWKNMLEPTANATITLGVENGDHSVEQGTFVAGVIPTMGEVGNETAPFVVQLADTYTPNEQVDLLYTLTDGEYTDQGGVFFIAQPSYRDHDINDIRMTLTNDGNLGFDDMDGVLGSGFRYKESESVLFEGAFMLGAVVNQLPFVVDVARSSATEQIGDFDGEQLYRIVTPGPIAPQQGYGHFEDSNAPLSYRVQTDVTQRSYAFTDEETRNVVFLRYDIANVSTNLQERLHAGLFFDWDISMNSQSDMALFNDSLKMAICLDTTGAPRIPVVVGVLPLSTEAGVTYWGINNRDIDDTLRIGIYNGFSKAEKWKALSQGVILPRSDVTDVSQVIASGPVDLPAGDTLVLGFALIAGETIRQVTDAVPHARDVWTRVLRPIDITSVQSPPSASTPALLSVSPQPLGVGQLLRVDIEHPQAGGMTLDLHDISGRFLYRVSEADHGGGKRTVYLSLPRVSAGTYILRAKSPDGVTGTAQIKIVR